MRRAILVTLAVSSFTVAPGLTAQNPTWQPWSWSTDSLQSHTLGTMRRVRIALPFEYTREGFDHERYPVLLIVGADDGAAFGAVLANLRLLESPLGGAVPPLIVIGVMPGANAAQEWYPPGSTALAFRKQESQAVAVGEFLTAELLPWIRERFRTLPYTIIAGHSAPGHFAVYAFARFPEVFQAAVAVSPAFWWDTREANDDTLSLADAERIAARKDRRRLFIAVAAHDPANIRAGVDHLTKQLGSRGMTTQVRHEILTQDNHQTSRQAGYVSGLRWVLSPVSLSANEIYGNMKPFGALDTALLARAYSETRRRYVTGARELGFPESLPESYVTAMGRFLSSNSQPALLPLARRICEDAIAWHSTRPNAHICLADVLLLSDSVRALRHYEAALTLARAANLTATVQSLDRRVATLKSALKQ